MAAPNYTPVSLYYSTTPSAVPTNTNLLNGELALNIYDKKLYAKDSTGAVFLLASQAGTLGTVTNVSVVSANGLAGTVANATTAAAITLSTTVTGVLKGNGTAISAAAAGTDYAPATAGSSILYGNGSGGFSNVTVGTGLSFAGGTLSTTGTGTVTSVAVSGGTTGLTTTGSPITTNGTITLTGTLGVANGGTGTTTLTGYVKGTGVSPLSATSTIPTTDLSGTVSNAQLANSNITINGNTVSLGGSTNITAAAANALTIGTGLSGTSYNGSAPVTVAIDSTVVTLNGTQTLTNKTLTSPNILNTIKFTGSGASAYTPFVQTFASYVTNYNGYQLNYIENVNNGSDASVDYVAYNDASDVDSYFVDMGISSSNYSNATYTIFPANGGYLYTGGGTSGQASALLLGTSNSASDLVMFTGGTLLANTRATVKGNTGNVLINTTTDSGYKLNVNGTTYFGGASTFGSTVLLNADPTLSLQAATKQYVDAAVSTGFVVHTPARLATTAALPTNTYSNGSSGVGATLTATANGALSVDSVAVATSDRILVKNQAAPAQNGVYTVTATGSAGAPYVLTRATDFDTAAAGEIANNAYFFVTEGTVNAGSSFILSQTAAITVGTTALPFTLFNDQLDYTGGTNINVTGTVISLNGTVAATNGGTGTSTVTTGDLLYGSATNTWSKLPLGIGYKSLVVNAGGTQLEWNAVALNQNAAVSGQLGISNGGTGQSTANAGFNALAPTTSKGDLIVNNGTANVRQAVGADTYVLTADSTTASGVKWAAAAASGVSTFSGGSTGFTPSTATSGAVVLAGTLVIANGGTGATTVAAAQSNLQVDPAGTAVAMSIALG
jgi:hypothetical protein